MSATLTIIPVTGIGDVSPGDDVAAEIAAAISGMGETLTSGDIVVVTHKVLSKAEGRIASYTSEEEYRQLVEEALIGVVEQAVRPFDRVPESLLTSGTVGLSGCEDPEPLVESDAHLGHGHGSRSRCRQLDRERQTIEPGKSVIDESVSRRSPGFRG